MHVCLCVCEDVCDLVLQSSLIRLGLSIDQSGLCVEIKVFLSLDNPVARWEYRKGVGKLKTLGHIWPLLLHLFIPVKGFMPASTLLQCQKIQV